MSFLFNVAPQDRCTPSGVACYQSLATEYQCLPSCTGIYADIKEELMEEDQRESIRKMQEEYLDYKNLFGELRPYKFVNKFGSVFGE